VARLQDPETGLVVTCEGDLAESFQSRGWVALDEATELADETASGKSQKDAPTDDAADDKPVRRSQSRRR